MKWERMPLTDFIWFQRGFDLPRESFKNGEIPVVGSTSILGYHNEWKVKAPGIVTGRSGTIGKFQFIIEDFWPHNTTLWVKDFKGNDERFAYYLLNTLDFNFLNAGGAVPTLNRNFLGSITVKVPPLPTQRRIASILSAYDDLIENNMKRIKLLEEAARCEYRLMMTNEKLEKKSILNICYVTDGTHDSPMQQNEGFYLITGKHLVNGFIDFSSAYCISIADHEKIQKRSKLDNGDVILSNIGTLGNVALIDYQFEFSVKNVIIFKPSSDIYSTFLYCYLQSDEMQTRYKQESSGTSQQFISLKYCRDLTVYLPSEVVLYEFHSTVSKIFKLKSILNQQNSKLREARDILLPRLMNGEVEV